MEQRGSQIEPIYQSGDRAACFEYALVLKAAGIPHDVRAVSGTFVLFVMTPDAERARAELDAYAQEKQDVPGAADTIRQVGGGWWGVLGYVAVVLLVAVFERQKVFGLDWSEAGKTSAGLILNGAWWRTVTALTLHADISHLLANTIIGGMFGLFAGQLLGSGLAWSSILVAGAVGNLLNACVRPPTHTSIGASTAIFAALGMVAAYAWVRRRHLQAGRLMRWAPLVGGVVLLSYFGAGGIRTDVAAHVAGFLAGLLFGAVYGRLGNRLALSRSVQVALGILTLAVLAIAWTLALTRPA